MFGDHPAELWGGDKADSILSADISFDHRSIAAGGPGSAVNRFDAKTGEKRHRIKKHTDWITAFAFSSDGSMLASGDWSGGGHVRETESGGIVCTLDDHKVEVTDLRWRSDGKVLARVAEDGNLMLWDMKDGWPLRNVSAHQAKSESRFTRMTGVLSVDFDHTGHVLTVGGDRKERLWSPAGDRIREISLETVLPTSGRFLTSKQWIVGSFDGGLQLFDLSKPDAIQHLPNARSQYWPIVAVNVGWDGRVDSEFLWYLRCTKDISGDPRIRVGRTREVAERRTRLIS